MKLMMIIVQDQDSYTLVDDLLEEGYRSVVLAGFYAPSAAGDFR